MKNQEILNALNEKIKAAEEALLYLNQTKAGLERVIENHKTPCEEAHKKVYGHYPDTGIGNGYSYIWWDVFQKGYNAAKEETVSKYQSTAQTQEEVENPLYTVDVEKLKASNWYVNAKTLLKSNWEPTQVSAFRYNQRTYIRNEYAGLFAWLVVDKADSIEDEDTLKILENEMNKQKEEYPYKKYTPEETEKSLKDAMKTAQSEGVFDEPETLTLKNLLKKWEFDFSAKWENPKNRTSELYEEEVERFIQMFIEWVPDYNKDYGDGNWEHGWNTGYNAYRNTVMEKLK